MTDTRTNPERAALQRIAAARAARAPVDADGRPTQAPAAFVYDDHGHLVQVVPAPELEV